MRLPSIAIALWCLFAAGCTKEHKTIINNIPPTHAGPSYVVFGLHDFTFTNGFGDMAEMDLTVQYLDSAQQHVQLSLSGLPPGISVDTNWLAGGVPTFNSTLRIFNDPAITQPGLYPIVFTATNDLGQQKTLTFNIRVKPVPAYLMGKYSKCENYCDTVGFYTDSLYIDPIVQNKIWFTNFGNWGNPVYGILTNNGTITIPRQTSGSMTYDFKGSLYLNRHINMSFGTSCAMDMY